MTTALEDRPTELKGDYPGRLRIVVTDASGHDQRGLLWGIRSRHYDPAATAKLFYEAEPLTPLDAAAVFAHAGASGGSTMRHNSLPGGSWCPVLETDLLAGPASLTHQGSYQVWARVYSATAVPQLRLLWGIGDVAHPVTNAAVPVPGAGAFWLVNLGAVRLDKPPTGGYAWHGLIQALAVNTNDPVEIDCLYLQPLDEYAGECQAVQSGSQFTSMPNQSFIAGTSEPTGVAVDGTYIYWANYATNTIGRALLNGTSPNQSFITGASTPSGMCVDATYVYWTNHGSNKIGRALLNGTSPNQGFITGASAPFGVAVDGTYIYWANAGWNTIGRMLKTGTTPVLDAVIYANRTAELRTEGMFRQDSTGTVEGAIAQVTGDLPRLPPSGVEARAVELFLRPTRSDIATEPDTGLDAFTAQVSVRPAWLFGP